MFFNFFSIYFQGYSKTSIHGEKTEWNSVVTGRKVRFNIVDTSGGRFISPPSDNLLIVYCSED
jgi:hypothetical protein